MDQPFRDRRDAGRQLAQRLLSRRRIDPLFSCGAARARERDQHSGLGLGARNRVSPGRRKDRSFANDRQRCREPIAVAVLGVVRAAGMADDDICQ